MIVVDFDENRPHGEGQYHVRLIDADTGDFGNEPKHQSQLGYWCDMGHLVSGVLAPLLCHIEDDDLTRVRRYSRPKKPVTVTVTWAPSAIHAALQRLIGIRDNLPGPHLLHDEMATMVAIDALRAILQADDNEEEPF